MKKTISIIVAVLILLSLLAFSACGNEKPKEIGVKEYESILDKSENRYEKDYDVSDNPSDTKFGGLTLTTKYSETVETPVQLSYRESASSELKNGEVKNTVLRAVTHSVEVKKLDGCYFARVGYLLAETQTENYVKEDGTLAQSITQNSEAFQYDFGKAEINKETTYFFRVAGNAVITEDGAEKSLQKIDSYKKLIKDEYLREVNDFLINLSDEFIEEYFYEFFDEEKFDSDGIKLVKTGDECEFSGSITSSTSKEKYTVIVTDDGPKSIKIEKEGKSSGIKTVSVFSTEVELGSKLLAMTEFEGIINDNDLDVSDYFLVPDLDFKK